MVINKHTRVSEVIKANADSITAIAALARPLRKLNNPLLRRVMAPRVTLAEAAAIGGCSFADIRAALEPLGFRFAADVPVTNQGMPAQTKQPEWVATANEGKTDIFDVRNIIEVGDDPLKAIVQRYRALPPDNLLCIINSFIPYPLLSLLEKKGAKHYVETITVNEHHTWFFKPGPQVGVAEQSTTDRVVMHDGPSFEQVLNGYSEAQRVRLDVRPLPMPRPMETILETLPTLTPNQVLYVQHKRVPLHLLEELADQAYTAHIYEEGEGDVKLLITGS